MIETKDSYIFESYFTFDKQKYTESDALKRYNIIKQKEAGYNKCLGLDFRLRNPKYDKEYRYELVSALGSLKRNNLLLTDILKIKIESISSLIAQEVQEDCLYGYECNDTVFDQLLDIEDKLNSVNILVEERTKDRWYFIQLGSGYLFKGIYLESSDILLSLVEYFKHKYEFSLYRYN